MKAAKQFNPDLPLRSIIKATPISPSERAGVLLALIGDRRTNLAVGIGVHYLELSRGLNGHWGNPELR